jgi:hypothetical protein
MLAILRITVGTTPDDVDEIFPPRMLPMPPTGADNQTNPVATGAGFFTPDGGGNGPLFRGMKQDLRMQAFRTELPTGSM